MIGYVCLGTNDLPRAAKFYDEVLGVIGAKRQLEFDRGISWGVSMQHCALGIMKPFDGSPATVGNGVMAAIVVDSKEKVAALHEKALALGATDEGPVGPRGPGFYAGYFRDLDGNKLNVFCMGPNAG